MCKCVHNRWVSMSDHRNLCLWFDFIRSENRTEPKLKNETLCGSSNSILAFKNKFNFRGLLHIIRNKWTLNTILLSIHRNQLTQFRISQLKSYWTMCRNLVLIREGEWSFCSFACSLNWIRVPLLFSRPFFVCVIHLSIFQCHIVSLFQVLFYWFLFWILFYLKLCTYYDGRISLQAKLNLLKSSLLNYFKKGGDLFEGVFFHNEIARKQSWNKQTKFQLKLI